MKLTKQDIIKKLIEKGFPAKDAKLIVDLFFHLIVKNIKDGKRVEIPGFGVFFKKRRKKRYFLNPKTKKVTEIPGGNVLDFSLSPTLRRKMKE